MKKEDENYIYYIFGQNLKKQRVLKELTQEQLANKSTYNLGFIKNLESKKVHQTASMGTAYKFAQVLGIHITDLFEDLEEEQ